MTKIRS